MYPCLFLPSTERNLAVMIIRRQLRNGGGGKGKKEKDGGRRKEGRDKGKRSDSFKDVLKLTICAVIQVHESQGNVHSQ